MDAMVDILDEIDRRWIKSYHCLWLIFLLFWLIGCSIWLEFRGFFGCGRALPGVEQQHDGTVARSSVGRSLRHSVAWRCAVGAGHFARSVMAAVDGPTATTPAPGAQAASTSVIVVGLLFLHLLHLLFRLLFLLLFIQPTFTRYRLAAITDPTCIS